MSKKVAIVLSGCGRENGSEITEAVSVILSLSELGCRYEFFAPSEKLKESAKISRAEVRPLEDLKAAEFDGLVFPGGMGAAAVLSNYSTAGIKGQAIPSVEKVITEFHKSQLPILAICIAPTLLALTLGKKGVTLTLGGPSEAATEIAKTGVHVENCAVTDFVTDREHKVITTPAYMYGSAKPFEVYTGIRKAVRELFEMA
jgi:enhancing lycopene biosynthesis protein 2